ncbi:MAG: mobile mystery protein A [Candidatus Marinimicrobia bacterium]|nr:mobile mystery protein A [Candidatus Neomarinimicrobiota bacterium]
MLKIKNQLDTKLKIFSDLAEMSSPPRGWIFSIRKALNMSLRQLGEKMGIKPQSVHEIEDREKNGTISINVLRQAGRALNMQFVYGYIPEGGSLDNMIEKRAHELAIEIVQRTSVSMGLEDQQTSEENIAQAIEEKKDELIRKMPRHLWN